MLASCSTRSPAAWAMHKAPACNSAASTACSCSIDGSAATDSADDSQSGLPGSPSCALGSTITLSIGLLLGLSWLLRRGHERFHPHSPERQLAPRVTWPSANPRASPALSC